MKATSPSSESARKRWFVPLGTRLAVPVLLLVTGVAVAAYFSLARTSRVTAMRSKEVAADMVAQLMALSVMPAVVFNDEEEMRRGVADVGKNPEITDVEIWTSGAEPALAGAGSAGASTALVELHRKDGRKLGLPRKAARARVLEADSVVAVEPIAGPDGKIIATLSLRMSTRREAQALAALTSQLWYASIGSALGLALAIVLVLRRLVVAPIRRLQRAAVDLKSGTSTLPESLNGAGRFEDEVAQLADTFVDMAEAVRDREARLAVRNGELKLILDSVEQGFFTALPSGELLPERSAVVHTWLGDLPESVTIWDVVGRLEPTAGAWLCVAWDQMQMGLLPLEVSLDQLPKRVVQENRYFDLAYHPVMRGDELDRMVIVLTDVTAAVQRELVLAEQHEFSVLVDQLVRDRRAFLDFWREANGLVDRIIAGTGADASAALRRDVHTLKGNSRFFGLSRLAKLCHKLEDAMQERGENLLTDAERHELSEAWGALRRRIEPLMHGATPFLQVSEEEYERLLQAFDAKASVEKLREQLVGLRYEPTAWRLERAREMLFAACERLGKPRPDVQILHHDLRLPPERWVPFWSVLPHLLNNAADHGLESADERSAAGKPPTGVVKLETRLERDELIVELSDDGPGVDWDKVRAMALARGLPADAPADWTRALLSDGFSLKDSVSETSGRGVGLAAVNAVVQALGGRIEIDSSKGQGTRWRIKFSGAGDRSARIKQVALAH